MVARGGVYRRHDEAFVARLGKKYLGVFRTEKAATDARDAAVAVRRALGPFVVPSAMLTTYARRIAASVSVCSSAPSSVVA